MTASNLDVVARARSTNSKGVEIISRSPNFKVALSELKMIEAWVEQTFGPSYPESDSESEKPGRRWVRYVNIFLFSDPKDLTLFLMKWS